MAIFDQFPYTNFHELNLDWIIAEMKKLKDLTEDLNPEEVQKLIEELRTELNMPNAVNINAMDKATKLYDIDIPTGYRNQGGCVHNGYLYVAHIKSGANTIISKYNYADGTLVSRLDIGAEMHCNSMTVLPNDKLLCAYTDGLVYVDIATFTVDGIKTVSNAFPSSITIRPDLSLMACINGGTGNPTLYFKSNISDNYVMYGTTKSAPKQNGLVQDSAAGENLFFNLITNSAYFNNLPNIIRVFTWRGSWYGDIYFDNNIIEPEVLDYNESSGYFTIVDSENKVYQLDVSGNMLKTSHAGLRPWNSDYDLVVVGKGDNKVTGSIVKNDHDYLLDVELEMPPMSSTDAHNLLYYFKNISIPFDVCGTVVDGSFDNDNNRYVVNTMDVRSGVSVKLQYAYTYSERKIRLTAYVIGYVSSGSYNVIRKSVGDTLTETEVIDMFSTDFETAITATGLAPYSYDFVFESAWGFTPYHYFTIIESYYHPLG